MLDLKEGSSLNGYRAGCRGLSSRAVLTGFGSSATHVDALVLQCVYTCRSLRQGCTHMFTIFLPTRQLLAAAGVQEVLFSCSDSCDSRSSCGVLLCG